MSFVCKYFDLEGGKARCKVQGCSSILSKNSTRRDETFYQQAMWERFPRLCWCWFNCARKDETFSWWTMGEREGKSNWKAEHTDERRLKKFPLVQRSSEGTDTREIASCFVQHSTDFDSKRAKFFAHRQFRHETWTRLTPDNVDMLSFLKSHFLNLNKP